MEASQEKAKESVIPKAILTKVVYFKNALKSILMDIRVFLHRHCLLDSAGKFIKS